ncbi:hypothetical protein HanIR_Chr03g0119391 [Helianthus annuus]|nr:hypothetical protein HanIR_Chr03g0119391 [Helianthus annuus]
MQVCECNNLTQVVQNDIQLFVIKKHGVVNSSKLDLFNGLIKSFRFMYFFSILMYLFVG